MNSCLVYGGVVVAWSDDPITMYQEKLDCIVSGYFRYPELLRVYVDGVPWLFDEVLTKKQASRFLADSSFPRFPKRLKNEIH